jgi:hypothetical protein
MKDRVENSGGKVENEARKCKVNFASLLVILLGFAFADEIAHRRGRNHDLMRGAAAKEHQKKFSVKISMIIENCCQFGYIQAIMQGVNHV